MNVNLQAELREETLNAQDASFDDLNNKCPLLDAVLKETLRLHPAILENHHEVLCHLSVKYSPDRKVTGRRDYDSAAVGITAG